MKTDNELLELAAKAIGMLVLEDGEPWPRENIGWFFNQVGGHPPALYDRSSKALTMWAPLTDDGDALRLAVKLGLTVSQGEAEHAKMYIWIAEDGGDCAATRRAIVRAGAAIGEKMILESQKTG